MSRRIFKFLFFILFKFFIFQNSILFSNFNNENDNNRFLPSESCITFALTPSDSDLNFSLKFEPLNNNFFKNNNFNDYRSQEELDYINQVYAIRNYLEYRPYAKQVLQVWNEIAIGQKIQLVQNSQIPDEKDFLIKVLQSDPEYQEYCAERENHKIIQKAEQKRLFEEKELEKSRKIEQEKFKVQEKSYLEIQNLLDDYENQNLENNEKLDEKFKEILENRKQALQQTLEDKNCYNFEYESSIELLNAASDAGLQSNLLFPGLENFTQNQATKEVHIILKESYKFKIYGNNNFKYFNKAVNKIADLAQNFNVINATKDCFSWLNNGHTLLREYHKAFSLGVTKGVLNAIESTENMIGDFVTNPIETLKDLSGILESVGEIVKFVGNEVMIFAESHIKILDSESIEEKNKASD